MGSRARAGIVVASATLLVLPSLAFASPAAAADRLPDLGMARLKDFRITNENGRRLLRFTTVIVNVGKGAFRVRGTRRSTREPTMTTKQRIYKDGGGYRDVATPAVMFYAGDGHDHWHVRDLQATTLTPLDGGTTPAAGSKQGFCFFDNVRYRLSLPRAPRSAVYWGCGRASNLSVTMGLSVGWGDKYPWDIAYQYVDITDVEAGRYRLQVTADAANWFFETNDANNATWVDLELSDTSWSVTVLGYGPAA